MAERVPYLGAPDPFMLETLGGPLAPRFVLAPVDEAADLGEQLAGARFAVVAERPLTEAHLAAAPALELVVCVGVGTDHVDRAGLTGRGIALATTPEGTPASVAEHTVLLLLAACRHLTAQHAGVVAGTWPKWRHRARSHDLSGLDVGIAGFGRIGREVAVRLAAFGATLRAYAPSGVDPPAGVAVEPVASLHELAQRSRALTLHLPLTPRTSGIVDAPLLRRLGPDGILVNTARGGLVDEAALVAALRDGTLGAAGLDVLAAEPAAADHPLLRLPNVTVTPHVASGTVEALRAKGDAIARRLAAAAGASSSTSVVKETA